MELCELLGIRPEIADMLIEMFPTQNAKEIMEIVADDLEYLNSLQKSTIWYINYYHPLYDYLNPLFIYIYIRIWLIIII